MLPLEKITYIAMGAIITTGFFLTEEQLEKKRVIEGIAAGIESGAFCPSETKSLQSITDEVQEIYFVGCGGFF